MSASWVIVSGDVGPWGGQDRANHALASFLARRGDAVHVVAHRVEAALAAHPAVTPHLVERPLRSHLAGSPALASEGKRIARAVLRRNPETRVIVNGGNCAWPDVNWVHAVHRLWPCRDEHAPFAARAKNRVSKALSRWMERRALQSARLILANSERTRSDLIHAFRVPPDRIAVRYLGCDPRVFGEVTSGERAAARAQLGVGERFTAVFVGALGYDRNKGLDLLLAAWRALVNERRFDGTLLVAGDGALPFWSRAVERAGVRGSVRLLGGSSGVAALLAAADVLVSPSRYESYGLNVHEALCRGIPAIASARAGVAERFTSALRGLLVREPENVTELAERIWRVRTNPEPFREEAARLGASLRGFTWEDMAAEIVRTIERTGAEA